MTKEAVALQKAGFEVKVIYCPMSVWGDEFDKELFNKYPEIKWISVGAHPILKKYSFLLTRIRRKMWEFFYDIFGDRLNAALRASSLYTQDLEREALQHDADLYIGHNLGSIKAVLDSSKNYDGLSSFDFEDFHRGEDLEDSKHWKLVATIENSFIPFIELFTAASPLIAEEYQSYYSNINILPILNVFNKTDCSAFIDVNIPHLKLFWFSQTIGKGRGIECLIEAMGLTKQSNIRLTLLGNITEEMRSFLMELTCLNGLDSGQLVIKETCSLSEIYEIASQHHIGICSEDPKTLNRDLCLTNKIFTYLGNKNAILCTGTTAQSEFLNKYPNIGFEYQVDDPKALNSILLQYYSDRKLLNEHRNNAYEYSNNQLNWEIESRKLVDFYNEALRNN
jgi:glycosyltransferase involved in cell wall biosynthesis